MNKRIFLQESSQYFWWYYKRNVNLKVASPYVPFFQKFLLLQHSTFNSLKSMVVSIPWHTNLFQWLAPFNCRSCCVVLVRLNRTFRCVDFQTWIWSSMLVVTEWIWIGERCVGYVKVVSAALFPVNTLRHTDIYILISFVKCYVRMLYWIEFLISITIANLQFTLGCQVLLQRLF